MCRPYILSPQVAQLLKRLLLSFVYKHVKKFVVLWNFLRNLLRKRGPFNASRGQASFAGDVTSRKLLRGVQPDPSEYNRGDREHNSHNKGVAQVYSNMQSLLPMHVEHRSGVVEAPESSAATFSSATASDDDGLDISLSRCSEDMSGDHSYRYPLATCRVSNTQQSRVDTAAEPRPNFLLIDGRMVKLLPVAQVGRYDRRVKISKDTVDYKIPAMTVVFADRPAPLGWNTSVHPEGAVYFYHEKRKVYTDADLFQKKVLQEVNELADSLFELLSAQGFTCPLNDTELVLEPDGDKNTCGYYFVNPNTRCLFWLDDFDGETIFHECKGVTSLSHKRYEIEALYWKHLELFPCAHKISNSTLNELKQKIIHATGDSLTSNVSTAIYNVTVLKDMLKLANQIQVVDNFIRSDHSISFVGRIMYFFLHNQFLNFHGQQGARLCRGQSVHKASYKRSLVMTVLSPLLWSAPDAHVRALHELYVDTHVNQFDWTRFVGKLNIELQDFNLLATVLLNANVGFLAIQSVDNGGNYGGRSLAQIGSYLSIVASLGSIILGLMLVRHNHTRLEGRDTLQDAVLLLSSMFHPRHGLETLAIIYSLPYALLLWGMVFFVLAFSAECFQRSSIAARVPVSVTGIAVLVLIAWSVHITREKAFLPGLLDGVFHTSRRHGFRRVLLRHGGEVTVSDCASGGYGNATTLPVMNSYQHYVEPTYQ